MNFSKGCSLSTFHGNIVCPVCQRDLRLIALVRTEAVIKTILAAMGLPAFGPQGPMLERASHATCHAGNASRPVA